MVLAFLYLRAGGITKLEVNTGRFTLGEDSNDSKDVETGPLISIRHPECTSADQRQDIPIMIFTPDQWESLEKRNFILGGTHGPKDQPTIVSMFSPCRLVTTTHFQKAMKRWKRF